VKDIEVGRSEVNEERYRARLDQNQLHKVIAEAVAKAAGLRLDDKRVQVKNVHISIQDTSTGMYREATCEIVVDRRVGDVPKVAS
jgi:hypothetical protein